MTKAECGHHFGNAMEYGSIRSWKTWVAHSPIWLPVLAAIAYTLRDPLALFDLIAAVEPTEHFEFAPMVFFNAVALTAIGGATKRVYVYQFGNALALVAALPSFFLLASFNHELPAAALTGIMATGAFFSWAAVTAFFDFNVECARGENHA